jgi:hypothetical protein
LTQIISRTLRSCGPNVSMVVHFELSPRAAAGEKGRGRIGRTAQAAKEWRQPFQA